MPATYFKPTMTIESSSLPVWRQQQQQQVQKIQIEGQNQQVVISGVAGRFPEALNIEQYSQCLFNYNNRTTRQESQQFDAQFYGISSEIAQNMTTVQKQITEQIYDSLIDAGVRPVELRNNRTGLFIATNIVNKEHTRVNAQFYQTVFNFQGPVQMFEEQFSSSFFALDQARRAIQENKCEHAIVCAVEITSTGVPTIASIFLQKRDEAKRFYAVLLQSQVIPSCEYKQIQQVYNKWNVEPSLVTYVETIGQNNQVEQYRCLAQVYAVNGERSLPVLIGQAETEQKYATGIQALIRMIVAIQTGVIPASQQQQKFSQEMFSHQDVKMVKTNTKFFGGLMALNSFTVNGQFINILVQPNTEYLQTKMGNKYFWNQQVAKDIAQMPRLYTCAAQSQQALEQCLEQVRQNPSDLAAQFLLSQQSQLNASAQQQYRAYTILNTDEKIQQSHQVCENRPVFYLFNGVFNTEFLGNYEQMMKVQRFRESIEQACQIMMPYGINLKNYICQQQKQQQQETIGYMVAHTAIQMALVDCLRAVGAQQSGMLGYSAGELACAYADECLTFEQTLLTAYQRAKLIQDSRFPSGAMATVSLTWEQAQKRCPATITLACHNYENNVTVSGPLDAIRTFVQELARENIQAKILNTNEIAYHSQYMTSIASQLKKRLEQIITSPKQRSAMWLSTSFGQQRWSSEMAKYASAEYFVNNLCNHVLLRETMSQIPTNAIVVEIGPQSVMDMIVKNNMQKSVYCPLMTQRQEQQLINFWTQLGNIYLQGVQVQPMNILVSTAATVYPVPVSTRFLTAKNKCQQYKQYVDDAQELKSQLEKKYENLVLKGESCKCVNEVSTKCQKHELKQQHQQQEFSVQQLAKQYMQTYQQEKMIMIKYFTRQQQELTVQQRKIVEELEALIRQSPANQADWIAHFQQQLEILQTLDMYCPRQEAEQTRLIQDLKEMICEQIRYCRQSEVTRRQMEKQQYNALMAKDTQFKYLVTDRQQRPTTKYQVKYTIDMSSESECNLLGHKIQGKYVYPVSGFIYLIWKSYAKMMGYTSVEQCPIQFTNIKFLHQITMNAADLIQFTVEINQVTGLFQLIESNKVVCTGCVENLDSLFQFKQSFQTDILLEETISQSEIYESLRQRGYELNGEFQPITKACVNGAAGELVWSGKWIQFLDGMIQMSLLAQNTEGSCLPTLIRSIRIEPAQFLKQEQKSFRFQDENNNLTMTTLNADWLQEEYQYLIKSANKQAIPVRQRSQWFARLQQYQQEQILVVRQWMRMFHETPVTATQKKMVEELENQLCQFQRQYSAVNVEEMSEKAWNELVAKVQEQAELAHQINTCFYQARRQNTVQEGPVSPFKSASVSQVRMIEDLRQIVREQLQYQEREQIRRMQTCQEQKQFNSLYRRQLDILRSLTQAQCRLPVELNMLGDMEKLIQEQQYRHEAMSPVSLTVKNWMNQLRQQQIILNEYFVQAQTPELRQIYTFLVKLCKDQLQQEMDFQTEARQIHGFVSQKLTTNLSLVQKLMAMSNVEEQDEESTLKRMYLEKLEQLVQEMYDQTMLTQAIQESMQETYQTRCVQLREYLTTLEKMTGRQQEQEVESSPVQRQVRQMRETLTKFYQEARQFRQYEQTRECEQQQMTIPVFYNAQTRSVYSQGVEISGLYMAPVVSVAPITINLREQQQQEQRFTDFFSEDKTKCSELIEMDLLNLIEAMHSLESLRETAETLRDTAQSIKLQEQQQPIQVSAKFTTKVSFSPLQAYISSTLDEAERQLIEETMSSMASTYMPVQYQQMTKKYNYLMPQKCIEPLNEVEIYSQFKTESTMVPVVIVHPIEGHTNTLRTLARNIRAPVYGIQFTREALKYETVEELAKFYWTQIRNYFGEQTRVHLCGHAFGAMIALEMALNQPQKCVSLTVLDDNMTQMSYDMYREQREEMEADAMMKFALQYYQSMNKVQFFNQLTEFKTTEERIRYIVKELMARSQFQFESVDLKDAIRAYIQKYVMQCQYIPTMQLRLPAVYLVKCGQLRQSLVQTKTYLQQLIERCFNGRLESEQVDCDVRSFLEGTNAYQVATIINENMLRYF